MNAPFSSSSAEVRIDNRIIALAWRGACLEIFSRGEACVDECLSDLRKSGWSLGKDSQHPGAKARLGALSDFIAVHPPGTHADAATGAISTWSRVAEARLCLAHGLMKVRKDGSVRLQLNAATTTRVDLSQPIERTQVEMVALLHQIEGALHALRCQLGTVRAMKPTESDQPL